MPIAFRDAAGIEELGLAGYLTLQTAGEGGEHAGALFLINARGEPVEFTYSRLVVPQSLLSLWRPVDVRRYVERSLTAALLDACPLEPVLLLARAEETHPDLFRREIAVDVPVVRIAPKPVEPVAGELSGEGSTRRELAWYPAAPRSDTRERRLIDELTARGLLLEPFERADRGLNEVYDPGSESGPMRSERGGRSRSVRVVDREA